MNSRSIFIFLLLFGLMMDVQAGNDPAIFYLNEEKIIHEMNGLNQLEKFVSNKNINLSQMISQNNSLLVVSNLDIEKSKTFSVNRIAGEDGDKTMMYVLIAVGAGVLIGLAILMFCIIG